jgi:hypothetical protein
MLRACLERLARHQLR